MRAPACENPDRTGAEVAQSRRRPGRVSCGGEPLRLSTGGGLPLQRLDAGAQDARQGLIPVAQLGAIRAPVLYVLSRTDPMFSPALAREVLALPGTQGWSYVELDSEKGHFASGADAALWADALRRLMETETAQ